MKAKLVRPCFECMWYLRTPDGSLMGCYAAGHRCIVCGGIHPQNPHLRRTDPMGPCGPKGKLFTPRDVNEGDAADDESMMDRLRASTADLDQKPN